MSLMQELAYSKQAGIAFLGYGVSSTDGIQSVCALLKKEDFLFQGHQELFSTLQEMYEKGMPLDVYLLDFAQFDHFVASLLSDQII